MAYTVPQQYQNVNGATVNQFDPTQANSFLQNFSNVLPLYSTNTANDQQQANNLIMAYQYLSDPANQQAEDAQNGAGWSQSMLGQLQGDITEQTNLANYYGGNATPQAIGTFTTNLGNVGNLTNMSVPLANQQQLQQMIKLNANGMGSQTLSATNIMPGSQLTISDYLNQIVSAIQSSNSPMAIQAANQAAGNAKGFELGADPGNIGGHINGSADDNAAANWIYSYITSAQQGAQQLAQLQGTQNTQQNAILQGFTLGQAPVAAQQAQIENY